jgi:hypothetical protein
LLWGRALVTDATPETTASDESAIGSVAEALRGAAATASDQAAQHAAKVRQSASDAGITGSISRLTYTGAYALAYGAVYATVFVARSLPQENPLMHGFRDGGKAAMDELGGAEEPTAREPSV